MTFRHWTYTTPNKDDAVQAARTFVAAELSEDSGLEAQAEIGDVLERRLGYHPVDADRLAGDVVASLGSDSA
jgi:hypothetical protein